MHIVHTDHACDVLIFIILLLGVLNTFGCCQSSQNIGWDLMIVVVSIRIESEAPRYEPSRAQPPLQLDDYRLCEHGSENNHKLDSARLLIHEIVGHLQVEWCECLDHEERDDQLG